MAVRLNKYLADRGVGARRKCDELIAQGRVSVNGRVMSDLGSKVEEDRDRVSVDGRPVGGKADHVYYVLNKPVGVITTLDDPHGRRSVAEFLPRGARVYPVGRLDADTSGLLLLTNDGDLAHKLMHPRYGVQKVYRVRLAAEPRGDQLRRLAQGVRFDKDLVSGPARVRRIDPGFDAIMIELIIHEGRFRQVRRMCEAVGLEVTGLHRVGYGPIRLGPLTRGMFRELSDEEVGQLRDAASRPGGTRFPRSRPARATKPAAAAATKRAPDDDDEVEEREETFIPGGGVLRPVEESFADPGDEPVWPARAGGRRGDADWQDERGSGAAPARRERPSTGRPSTGERSGRARGPAREPARRPEARPTRAGARSDRTERTSERAPSRVGGRFERGPAPRGAAGRSKSRAPRAGGRFERRPAPRASEGRGGPRPDLGSGRFERRSATRGRASRRGEGAGRPFQKFERRPPGSAKASRSSSRSPRSGDRFERGAAERGPATRGSAGRGVPSAPRGGDRFERRPAGRVGARTPARGKGGPGRPGRGKPGAAPRRPAGRQGPSKRPSGRNPSRGRRG